SGQFAGSPRAAVGRAGLSGGAEAPSLPLSVRALQAGRDADLRLLGAQLHREEHLRALQPHPAGAGGAVGALGSFHGPRAALPGVPVVRPADAACATRPPVPGAALAGVLPE